MANPHFTMDAVFGYSTNDGTNDPGPFFEAVVEHLESLGIDDVNLVADLALQRFTISILIQGDSVDPDVEDVVRKGMVTLRTAFHACEAWTPGWPTPVEAFLGVELTPAEVRELTSA